jgi:hypothetical protein
MGAVLQSIQGVCQTAGCALSVVTRWNKTGDGRGADRISGAGPAAWARVICSVAIHYRGSDPDGASTVLLGAELIDGEIADTRVRIRRRAHADDPADPAARDRLAQAGHPLKPRTIQTALAELEAAGLARGSEEGNGRARYWSPAAPDIVDHAGRGEGAA